MGQVLCLSWGEISGSRPTLPETSFPTVSEQILGSWGCLVALSQVESRGRRCWRHRPGTYAQPSKGPSQYRLLTCAWPLGSVIKHQSAVDATLRREISIREEKIPHPLPLPLPSTPTTPCPVSIDPPRQSHKLDRTQQAGVYGTSAQQALVRQAGDLRPQGVPVSSWRESQLPAAQGGVSSSQWDHTSVPQPCMPGMGRALLRSPHLMLSQTPREGHLYCPCLLSGKRKLRGVTKLAHSHTAASGKACPPLLCCMALNTPACFRNVPWC